MAINAGVIEALLRLRDEMSPGLRVAAQNVARAGKSIEGLAGSASRAGRGLLPVTAAIGGVAAATLKLAMDTVESENLAKVSFGSMATAATAWSKKVQDAVGTSEYSLRKNAATLFTMTENMGVSRDAAFEMSTRLTELAGDMASFYNISVEEAFTKLRSGIVGEAEPLKQLGILVNEQTVKNVAYAQGIAATGSKLTEQQKVLARYAAIMEQTSKAQGDLARTADSPVNQIRRLGDQVTKAGTDLGMALLPMLQRVLEVLKALIPYLEGAVRWFTGLSPGIQNSIVAVAALVAALGPLLMLVGSVGSGVGALMAAVGAVPAVFATVATAATAVGGAIATMWSAAVAIAPLLLTIAAQVAAVWLAWEGGKAIGAWLRDHVSMVRSAADAVADWWYESDKISNALRERGDLVDQETGLVKGAAESWKRMQARIAAATSTGPVMKHAAAVQLAAQAEEELRAKAVKAAEALREQVKALGQELGGASLREEIRQTAAAVAQIGGQTSVEGARRIADLVKRALAEGYKVPHSLLKIAAQSNAKDFATESQGAINALPPLDLGALVQASAWAQDAAIAEAAAQAQSEALARAAAEAERLAAQTEAARQRAHDLATGFYGVADALDSLSLDPESGLGALVEGLSIGLNAAAQMTEIFANWEDMSVGERIAGGAQGVMGMVETIQTQRSGLGRTFSASAQGASAGASVGGPWGALAGGVIGALGSIFGGEPQWVEDINRVGRELGIELTQAMAEAIRENADRLGISIVDAALLAGPTLFREAGEEMRDHMDEIMHLQAAVGSGNMPLVEGTQALAEAWGNVREEAELANRVGDRITRAMLDQQRALGELTPEMQDFVDQALGRAISAVDVLIGRYETLEDGTRQFVGGLDLFAGLESVTATGEAPATIPEDVLRSRAAAQGAIFSGVFWAAVEEQGLLAATDAMREPFGRMIENLSEFLPEEEIAATFGAIGRLMDLTAPGGDETLAGPLRAALEVIPALQDAFTGLADSGYLTQQGMFAFGETLETVMAQMEAAGATPEEQIQAALPYLQDAISASQQYGFQLDANTQGLIDQAEAMGYAFQTDPLYVVVDLLSTIATQLGATLPASAQSFQDSFGVVSGSIEGNLAQQALAAQATAEQMETSMTSSAAQMQATVTSATTATQLTFEQTAESIAAAGDYIGIAWGGAVGELPVHISQLQEPIDLAFEAVETSIVGHAQTAAAAVGGITAEIQAAVLAAQGASATWPSNWGGAPPNPSSPTGLAYGGIVSPADWHIPHAAAGIIVPNRPGRGTAVVMGEHNSAEVAVPVAALFDVLGDRIAGKVAGAVGGGARTIHVHNYIGSRAVGDTLYQLTKEGAVEIYAGSVRT